MTPGLELDPARRWLRPVRRVPSPNCDARPPATAVDLAIIHGISLPPGVFGGGSVERLFRNTLDWSSDKYFTKIKGLYVSSHVFIERSGALTQFVPFHLRAWHAGDSGFAGRRGCNDFSVGIELEGTDEQPYEGVQYQRLAEVLRLLLVGFPGLTRQRIVGHCHVAPGRKTDPGPSFDWGRLRRLLEPEPE